MKLFNSQCELKNSVDKTSVLFALLFNFRIDSAHTYTETQVYLLPAFCVTKHSCGLSESEVEDLGL